MVWGCVLLWLLLLLGRRHASEAKGAPIALLRQLYKRSVCCLHLLYRSKGVRHPWMRLSVYLCCCCCCTPPSPPPPFEQVLNTITSQAWANSPHNHLSHKQLVTLLFSSAQLAVAVPPPPQEDPAAPSSTAQVESDDAEALSTDTKAAAAAASPHAAITAVAEQLILAAMPDTWPKEQQQQERLSLPDAIRVLWALCVYGCLDIAQYGWLLVGVAAGPWQRLSEEQLLVIHHGQV